MDVGDIEITMKIEIALDDYDDIFSDFDIRPYKERQVSKDFLDELKVRMATNPDNVEITLVLLYAPSQKRRTTRKIIVRRLPRFLMSAIVGIV